MYFVFGLFQNMLAYAVKHHFKKANMEIANKSNLTPLTLASKLGRTSIFKEFIELQSSVSIHYQGSVSIITRNNEFW